MRRRALLLLAAVAPLAGCAEEPPPLVAADPTYGEYDGRFPEGAELAPLAWHVLAEGAATIGRAPHEASLTIPPRTVTVLVNTTLERGAAYGLDVQLGACAWRRDTPFVALGQTIGADCGGLLPGSETLLVSTDAGLLLGKVTVTALVCASQGACVPPNPVPNDA